ncbi:MAG: hypothetical protein EXR65_00565 [Dehalococcoidia bacterium]|nr:hypothetical protein [Dehalococcoidia bacterium]
MPGSLGWQELLILPMVLAVLTVPYYFLWRMIRDRGASYWWMLLMLFGLLLGEIIGLIIGYFVIPLGDRAHTTTDRPDAP